MGAHLAIAWKYGINFHNIYERPEVAHMSEVYWNGKGRPPKGVRRDPDSGLPLRPGETSRKAARTAASRANRNYAVVEAGTNKVTLNKAGLKLVEELAEAGNSYGTMAGALNIASTTFERIRKENPLVTQAIERGRGKITSVLVSALIERALAGSDRCLLYALSTIGGMRENDPSSAPRTAVNVTFVSPYSAADARAILGPVIEVTPDEQ